MQDYKGSDDEGDEGDESDEMTSVDDPIVGFFDLADTGLKKRKPRPQKPASGLLVVSSWGWAWGGG